MEKIELYWDVFKKTGEIAAYLNYKKSGEKRSNTSTKHEGLYEHV